MDDISWCRFCSTMTVLQIPKEKHHSAHTEWGAGCSDWLWAKGMNGIKRETEIAGLILVVLVGVSHHSRSVHGLDTPHGPLLWQPHALPRSTHLGVVGGFVQDESAEWVAVHDGYLVRGMRGLDGAGYLTRRGRCRQAVDVMA